MAVRQFRAQTPDLTELAAAKFVETHGRDALGILEERAHLAGELGHKLAARTWHDMADAAARILRTKRAEIPVQPAARPVGRDRAAASTLRRGAR